MLSAVTTLPNWILGMCTSVIVELTQWLLVFSLLISIAFYCGWVHRFLWYLMESEASKILNHTPVTVGGMRVDILRGRLWASNVVLHAPRRAEWKWQSPVLARVGKLYVECNLVHCLLSMWFLWEEIPLEIYTLEVSDIQAFIERKHNLFNFYLMDPHVDLPDLSKLEQDEVDKDASSVPINTSMDASWEDDLERSSDVQSEKAQKLVEDMVRALGRATQRGSLQETLVESRERLKSQLKALQTTKKSSAMQEGVKIVQQVSKSLVVKTQNVGQVVVPNRKSVSGEKTVYARVGRVVIEDARIFTRDHQFEDEDTHNKFKSDSHKATSPSSASSEGSWNRPIYIAKVAVRAAELCPPLSAKDDKDYPMVYQPIDKSLEVLWKRVLTEVAKSNTGRLFQTAMGEVLDFWMTEKTDVSKSEST